MTSPQEWRSVKVALGDIMEHSRFEEFVHDTGDYRSSWVDFNAAQNDEAWVLWSEGQQSMIRLAAQLFGGGGMIGSLIANLDDEAWTHCVEAMTIRRGIDAEISEGQWIDAFPPHR